jgi:hypothetical protein
MTEDINPDEPTKDLTADLSDRQILLELRRTMGELVERVTALEHRTNPLPPNYNERFVALEDNIARLETEVREMRAELRHQGHKLDELAANALDVKAGQRGLAARVAELESRPS